MDKAQAPQAVPRHFNMLRSYHLADLITLANAFCGMGSILFLMSWLISPERWRMNTAIWLLPAALVFDVLDGSVARWRHAQSVLGRELDSLADIVSFGVAPASLAFALGLRGAWDGLILVFFVGCGISRLARFNVTAETLSEGSATGKVKYFEGTPIPTSLVLVLILATCFWNDHVAEFIPLGAMALGPFTWHPLSILYLISGSAMISKTLRVPKP